MNVSGRVLNGIVVPDQGSVLPEGVQVTIFYEGSLTPLPREMKRVELPLVPSKLPGSLGLTAEEVARALEEEDLAAGH